MNPWEEVHIDLIGPWKVKVANQDVEYLALTCIDPVTNLVELIRIENKTAEHVAQQFANCWLARYPWPRKCVHDNGGEFIGWEFQQLLEQCGIIDAPTTSRNPQANAICERMHQTVGNVLRTLLHGHPVQGPAEANAIIDNSLATTMHVLRSSVSRTLNNNSPGSLAFHRDMFLNLPLQADLEAIRQRRQILIDENLRRQNARRRHYDYQVGEQVLVKDPDGRKLDPKTQGPYVIHQVHANGTLTIQRAPFVLERIHLRRVFPFRTQ